jgi:hypothetical protein
VVGPKYLTILILSSSKDDIQLVSLWTSSFDELRVRIVGLSW